MADLNVTYHPYTHEYDIRAIKNELLYEFFEEDSEIRQNMDKMVIVPLTEFNTAQHTLSDAVSLPYTGTTTAERTKWLKDRIEAVYDRLDMIRSDTEGNKQMIINAGGEPPIDALATIGQFVSLIPAFRPVGELSKVISKLVNRSNDNAGWKREKIREGTEVIQGYAGDTQQLNNILKQLYTEYSTVGTVPKTSTDGSLFNAFKAWPVWYYYAGFGAFLLLLLIIRKRRLSRYG